MYLRFVTTQIDSDSHHPVGVIQAAYDLLNDIQTSHEDKKQLLLLYNWFCENLDVPDRFSKSRKPTAQYKGISWFKDTPDDCIFRAYQVCEILNRNHIVTEKLITSSPGYILYEDDHQVCAMPFKDSKKQYARK